MVTGCSPTHNYQYGVPGMSTPFVLSPSANPFSVVLFARVALGLLSVRGGQSRRTAVFWCRTLGFSQGYRRHCAHWKILVGCNSDQRNPVCLAASLALLCWPLRRPGLTWDLSLENRALFSITLGLGSITSTSALLFRNRILFPLKCDYSGSSFSFPPHTTGGEFLISSHWAHLLGWL